MKRYKLYFSILITVLCLVPTAGAGAAENYGGPYRHPDGKTPPGLERREGIPPGQVEKMRDNGRYHPDRRYDDGQYHPGKRRDDRRYHNGDPRRRHGDRYGRDRSEHRYDGNRHDRYDGRARDHRPGRDGDRRLDRR